MSKKCTPLWREAHFEVKIYKTPHVRATFGGSDVEKVHAVVARSTFRSQNYKTPGFRTTFGGSDVASLHYTTLHYTTLHYTALHYTTLHNTTTTLHYTTLHYLPQHFTTLKDRITPHVTNFSRFRLGIEKQEGKRKYKSDGAVMVGEFVCVCVYVCSSTVKEGGREGVSE